MIEKERLDVLMFKKGLAPSREAAKAFIMAGCVYVGETKEDKAGAKFAEDTVITVRSKPNEFVSRGGLKLKKAIKNFGISLKDKTCMDIGASTGGFTDCMLKEGAKKVYAVDVGYGQLAWSLRTDERVVVMEKTNARYLTGEDIKEACDFASIDVSFISLTKIIPPVSELLKENGCFVCLIKPQFEAGKEKIGKKGVVKDKTVHYDVIKKIIDFAFDSGLFVNDIDFSPIKGPEGNIEYLIYLSKKDNGADRESAVKKAEDAVSASHRELEA